MNSDLIQRAFDIMAVYGLHHGLHGNVFRLNEEAQAGAAASASAGSPLYPVVLLHFLNDHQGVAVSTVKNSRQLIQRRLYGMVFVLVVSCV
jgi:hypothetical protein